MNRFIKQYLTFLAIGSVVSFTVAKLAGDKQVLTEENILLRQRVQTLEAQRACARADVERFRTWGTRMGYALEELGHADRIPMVDWS